MRFCSWPVLETTPAHTTSPVEMWRETLSRVEGECGRRHFDFHKGGPYSCGASEFEVQTLFESRGQFPNLVALAVRSKIAVLKLDNTVVEGKTIPECQPPPPTNQSRLRGRCHRDQKECIWEEGALGREADKWFIFEPGRQSICPNRSSRI
jgi:hypothetical protein